jgi:hypothetical protein
VSATKIPHVTIRVVNQTLSDEQDSLIVDVCTHVYVPLIGTWLLALAPTDCCVRALIDVGPCTSNATPIIYCSSVGPGWKPLPSTGLAIDAATSIANTSNTLDCLIA